MTIKGKIKPGEYFDSVTLMLAGRELSKLPGVRDAAVVMGTRENLAILEASGLLCPELGAARDTDLLLAVSADDEAAADQALAAADRLLADRKHAPDSGTAEAAPRSLAGALRQQPDSRLALISVAGRYAAAEAWNALDRGLHVMLFSDNVALEAEIDLKRAARERGLLVMGPDCGTAIVNGIPLGFANVVERGGVGIVAAAGTGLQEVSVLVSNAGAGISQALGTGGRDVKEAVGGIMFVEALRALADDPATTVILLVSKPPHPAVIERIAAACRGIAKPVVSVFLGAPAATAGAFSTYTAATLEEAALVAARIARGRAPAAAAAVEAVRQELAARDAALRKEAEETARKLPLGRRYLRGLFSGGTFCAEAQLVLKGTLAPLWSNAPAGSARSLDDPLHSRENTLVDLGEDEFTVGRPHPMIDYDLRQRRLAREIRDPETAVILLDVVLGYGSHPDPAGELAPLIREAAGGPVVVGSVTGTDRDPQDRSRVVGVLEEAGMRVLPSNAAAALLAGAICARRQG
jgi:FdrA protein